MKKMLVTLFVMCMTIFPMMTKAAEELEKVDLANYKTMGLVETLESEEIKVKFDGYKESDDQVTVYLFRGSGCAYCKAFLNFLNDLPKEYYSKIKLVSFDAWYDEASAILLTNISNYLGEEAGGVPYIIIGKEVFPGYAETYNDGIKAAIDAQYKATEKVDVINDYNAYVEEAKKAETAEKYTPVLINAAVTVLCTVFVIFYISYSNSRLLYQLKGAEKETTYTSSYDKHEEVEDVEEIDEVEELEDDEEELIEEDEEIEEVEEEAEPTPVVKNNNKKNNKKNTHKNNNKKSKRR